MDIERTLSYKESHSVQFFTDDLVSSLDLVVDDLTYIVNHVNQYIQKNPDMSLTDENLLPAIMEYVASKVAEQITKSAKSPSLKEGSPVNDIYGVDEK